MEFLNVKELYEKLIKLTKEDAIKWKYLDEDKAICNNLDFHPIKPDNFIGSIIAAKETNTFDASNSFVADINNNHIIIYCEYEIASKKTLDERLSFMLVPRSFRGIRTFDSHTNFNDGTLLRLQSLVKSYFPSADDIIKDIYDM